MIQEFNYTREYIKKFFLNKVLSVFLFLISYAVILKIIGFASYSLIIISGLAILLVCLIINLFLLFKKPYMIIDHKNLILNHPYYVIKNHLLFDDIKESFLIANPPKKFLHNKNSFYNSPTITLHMKNGSKKDIRFVCLSEEDKQKVIEIFREKGLLKE